MALLLREHPALADDFWTLPHDQRRRQLESFFEAEGRQLHSDGKNFDKTFEDLGRIGAFLCAASVLDARNRRAVITHDVITLKRTWQHIFIALGRDVTGNKRRDRERYRSAVVNKLVQARGIGWLEGHEAVIKPSGEGDGILLRVRRDSSVGRAHD